MSNKIRFGEVFTDISLVQDILDLMSNHGPFGSQEVSGWLRLEILLQMGFGRARDDHPRPKTGTGTMSTCPSELAMCCKVRHWPS